MSIRSDLSETLDKYYHNCKKGTTFLARPLNIFLLFYLPVQRESTPAIEIQTLAKTL